MVFTEDELLGERHVAELIEQMAWYVLVLWRFSFWGLFSDQFKN